MALIAAFIVFMGSMVACIALGYSMLVALAIGLIAFLTVGRLKGFTIKQLGKMAGDGVKDSLVVIEVMFLIGFVTAIWRSAGTITFFVYYGTKIITPALFIVVSFLLCCLLSYVLGTSFGVAGTLGVILITLARSGGVAPVVAAGAIMSGVYFGDRCSPASSSAILVAIVTKTNIMDNVKTMFKTGLIPFGICLIIYGILSAGNPMSSMDSQTVSALISHFDMSLWAVVPAVFILVLPVLKVDIRITFICSIITGYLISVFVQGMDPVTAIHTCILGYESPNEHLGRILNGGGLLSMINVCCILVLSCSYSGIFKGTDMLEDIQSKLGNIIDKTGRFVTMIMLGILTTCVFCNQTIASMMCSDLLTKPYISSGGNRPELAMDIENSVIVIAGLCPWAIACTVPLSMMDVGYGALPYSCFLYLIPLCYVFTKKHWFYDGKSEVTSG